MDELLRCPLGDRTAVVVTTERTDGDLHALAVDSHTLRDRQVAVTGSSWVMLDEVHGTGVHVVGPSDHEQAVAGSGDVLVGPPGAAPLAVWAADCATLALFGATGSVAAVHAGWRGLAAGVVDVAVEEFAGRDEQVLAAVLGPCIHPCCYEFGGDDLVAVAAGVHAAPGTIAVATPDGRLALDVPAAVGAALGHHGVELDVVGPCTGCDDRWFSHRVRSDAGRHALVAWTEEAAGGVRG